jgi:hypothetical protein
MTSEALARRSFRRRARTVSIGAAGPRIVPLIFFTGLAIALFFAMIYLRIALDRTAFELDSIEDQIAIEESRQLDLRLEIAGLQDPLRITTEARRIGLTHPDERVPIEVSGVRDRAAPESGDSPVRALTEDGP